MLNGYSQMWKIKREECRRLTLSAVSSQVLRTLKAGHPSLKFTCDQSNWTKIWTKMLLPGRWQLQHLGSLVSNSYIVCCSVLLLWKLLERVLSLCLLLWFKTVLFCKVLQNPVVFWAVEVRSVVGTQSDKGVNVVCRFNNSQKYCTENMLKCITPPKLMS